MYNPSLGQLVEDHGGPANVTFMVPMKPEHPAWREFEQVCKQKVFVPVECKLDFSKYEGGDYKVTAVPIHFTQEKHPWWYSKDFYCSDFLSLVKDGIITICLNERVA